MNPDVAQLHQKVNSLKAFIVRLMCLVLVGLTTMAVLPASGQKMFDSEALLSSLEFLSSDELKGRGIGTEGSLKAREHVAKRFSELGVKMLDSTYFYGFAVVHPIKKKRIAGVNIVGLIPGSDEINKFIVVSSHYDHLGELRGEIYNGADDNASGTAAMMAVAEYFQKHPPSHSILLVSFDGEESGLVGSRRFVEDCPVSLDSVVCNVNLDMVGRNSQNELYICGTAHYPFLKPILDETIELAAIDILYGHDGGFGADNWTMASDHANFHRKKIPFVYFGVEDHDDYHEPTDDFEKIVPEFYISAVEYIVQVIEVLDRKL